jgi:hypothetical protein
MRRVLRRFQSDPFVAPRGEPNASPTSFRVLRDNSTVTRCAPLTNTKSLSNPNPSPFSPHPSRARPTARGPTTRFKRLLKSLSPPQPGPLAQLSRAPRGRSPLVSAPLAATMVAATAITAAVLASNAPCRAGIQQRYTGGSATVPGNRGQVRQEPAAAHSAAPVLTDDAWPSNGVLLGRGSARKVPAPPQLQEHDASTA